MEQHDRPHASPSFVNVFVLLLFAAVIAFISSVGTYMFITSRTNEQLPTNQVTTIPSDQTSTQASIEKGVTINKVFYAKSPDVYTSNNAIFSYDVVAKEITEWTRVVDDRTVINMEDVIDENAIGFLKCDKNVRVISANCSISVMNLVTKEVREKKKLDAATSLQGIGFYSPDKFAYEVVTNTSYWQFVLFDQGITKVLENFPAQASGRGVFNEDSYKIEFSPDGQHLLQIATTSGRGSEDFNIYIYALLSGEKQIITQATQPAWINENSIIYRKYKDGGLYKYNINTKTQERITIISKDVYEPSVLANNVVYTNNQNKQVFIYNLITAENKKIIDNALDAFWVTPTIVVYDEIVPCTNETEEGCNGILDYKYISQALFDIEKGVKIESIPDRIPGTNTLHSLTSQYK